MILILSQKPSDHHPFRIWLKIRRVERECSFFPNSTILDDNRASFSEIRGFVLDEMGFANSYSKNFARKIHQAYKNPFFSEWQSEYNTFSHPDSLLHTYMMINSAYFHFLLVIPSCIYLLQFHKENCITLSSSRSNLPFFTRIFFHSLVSQWKLIFWRTAKLLKIHDHFRTHIHFREKKNPFQ